MWGTCSVLTEIFETSVQNRFIVQNNPLDLLWFHKGSLLLENWYVWKKKSFFESLSFYQIETELSTKISELEKNYSDLESEKEKLNEDAQTKQKLITR